jgi:hypothetical protein
MLISHFFYAFVKGFTGKFGEKMGKKRKMEKFGMIFAWLNHRRCSPKSPKQAVIPGKIKK